ncbi:hypothetical protein [Flavobacterium sp. ACN6]|uniref:hypothetical protein n=1 Tax=Flavobacterium sp. ACN6 TaxID=1920426 RepID=UPI000BB3B048|nr:hypothetical protein [Flavobacterium sp. ACN6]PBJ11522.1 hypothetical protein BSF42_29290 [Flavobacterium sp. ACN6]
MLSNPQIYEIQLRSFLYKNKEKKEIDFIIYEIEIREKYLEEVNKKTDDDFRTEIEKEYEGVEKKMDEKHMEYLLNVKKERLKETIRFTNNELFSLGIYKDRLNQSKTKNTDLLHEGKKLNLSERYKILNKLTGIDKEIRKLNIGDLKKYEYLAIVLDCHPDSARDLMNGKYNSKDRNLDAFFDEFGIIK